MFGMSAALNVPDRFPEFFIKAENYTKGSKLSSKGDQNVSELRSDMPSIERITASPQDRGTQEAERLSKS
jgi:hypothetical protein